MIRFAGWVAVGWLAVPFAWAGGSVQVRADDAAGTSASATTDGAANVPSAELIQRWIKDLDNEKFATREQANQRLLAAGGAAVEAVAAAVDSKSREVSMRALQILEQFYRTGNAATKDKCRAALEKIARKADSAAAGKAAEIIKPQADAAPGGGIPIGNLQIFGGGVQVRNVQIRMQNVNGHRTVDATEGDRKVHIEDDPQTGIDMKVTEKVEGKAKTTQYKAKNLDELKKNHPAAEALYRKYAGGNVAGGIQVRLQVQNMAVPFAPQNAPFQPAPALQPPGQPAPAPTKAAEIAAGRKLLADLKQQIAKTALGNPDTNLQKAIEQLQTADERLADAEASAAK